jgi:hypothetical protein
MRTPNATMRGRGPTEEVESSWLGAEALPGGTVSAAEDAPESPDPPSAGDRGPAAWIAAVLSWARRQRSA